MINRIIGNAKFYSNFIYNSSISIGYQLAFGQRVLRKMARGFQLLRSIAKIHSSTSVFTESKEVNISKGLSFCATLSSDQLRSFKTPSFHILCMTVLLPVRFPKSHLKDWYFIFSFTNCNDACFSKCFIYRICRFVVLDLKFPNILYIICRKCGNTSRVNPPCSREPIHGFCCQSRGQCGKCAFIRHGQYRRSFTFSTSFIICLTDGLYMSGKCMAVNVVLSSAACAIVNPSSASCASGFSQSTFKPLRLPFY